mgnify:CR=1 FL=1
MPECAGFECSPLRVAESGAAAGARLTECPGTPPLRPRRSSLRRAALPGAGGRRLPHPGLRSSLVEQCFICGADGLCPNCLDSHLCEDDYDDE